MFCPSCGKEISSQSKFCRYCGATMQDFTADQPVERASAITSAPTEAPMPEPAPVVPVAPVPEPAPIAPVAPVPEPAPVAPVAPVPEPTPVAPVAPVPEPAPVTPVAAPTPEPVPAVPTAIPVATVAPITPAPVPAPVTNQAAPTGGKFCPNCGFTLTPGVKFCGECGKPTQTVGSGQVSINIDVDSVKRTANQTIERVKALNITKQKLAVVVASAIGMLATFFPWTGVDDRLTVYGTKGPGWITLVLFAVLIALCLLRDRTQPLGNKKFACIGVGAINAIMGLVQIIGLKDYYSSGAFIGFGVYLLILMSLAVCAIPFIKIEQL